APPARNDNLKPRVIGSSGLPLGSATWSADMRSIFESVAPLTPHPLHQQLVPISRILQRCKFVRCCFLSVICKSCLFRADDFNVATWQLEEGPLFCRPIIDLLITIVVPSTDGFRSNVTIRDRLLHTVSLWC